MISGDGRTAVPRSRWSKSAAGQARSVALNLLGGVGTGEDFVEAGELVYHVRRRLSDPELARLDPHWLAIPAIDMA